MYIFIHFSHFRLKEIHNFWDLLMPLMMIVCRQETVLEGSRSLFLFSREMRVALYVRRVL